MCCTAMCLPIMAASLPLYFNDLVYQDIAHISLLCSAAIDCSQPSYTARNQHDSAALDLLRANSVFQKVSHFLDSLNNYESESHVPLIEYCWHMGPLTDNIPSRFLVDCSTDDLFPDTFLSKMRILKLVS